MNTLLSNLGGWRIVGMTRLEYCLRITLKYVTPQMEATHWVYMVY